MIKLLISDIGGTLVKTDDAIIVAIEKVFKKLKIPYGDKNNVLEVFGVSLYDYILAYLPEKHKDKIDLCYGEFLRIYPDMVIDLLTVFKHIDLTLDYIKNKGIKIAILSCMTKYQVEKNLSLLKFQEFDEVFSIENYKFKRPEPIGLQMIMEELGVEPEETIYVGDTVNDILMAKNAGCISIAVKSGLQDNLKLKQAKPDYLIKEFQDLRKLI